MKHLISAVLSLVLAASCSYDESNERSSTRGSTAASTSTASFVKQDVTTQGSWKGVYGADGYNIAQDSSAGNPKIPAYATTTISGGSAYTWNSGTTNVRALQKSGATDRIAATWFGNLISFNVTIKDGATHQVALYALDWDTTTRLEKIEVIDTVTSAVLDTRNVSTFNGGAWLVWTISGNVTFKVTNTGPGNAVISGMFFDPASSPPPGGACQFLLTGARVLGDGRVVRLQWESGESVGQPACNRLAKTGFPDYLPAVAAGTALTASYPLSSGTASLTGETIAVQSLDHNRSQAWIPHAGFVPGGTLATGGYMFQVVLTDSNGADRFTHLWTGFANSTGGSGIFVGIPNTTPNAKVLLQWNEPVQPGWSVKIYGLFASNQSTNLKIYDMRLLKTVAAADLNSPTSLWITDYTPGTTPPTYKSTTWAQYVLFSSPIPFKAPVSFTAPAALLRDNKGNTTEAVNANIPTHTSGTAISVNNESLVGTDDWLAIPDNPNTPFGTLTFADTIYVSYSHGNDATGTGVLNNPYKTAKKAFTKWDSNKRNINIRFLRGDTCPAGFENQWTRAFWGTSRAQPFLIDSYWNPTYGSDPGKRPVIELMHPYWNGVSATQNSSTFAEDIYNATDDNQSRPYNMIRGLYLKGDVSYSLKGQTGQWPTLGNSNHQVISDTRLSNIELTVGKYAPPGLPTTGSMIHRSMVHDVQSGGADVPADKSDSGIWSGGATLYLHPNLVHPVPEAVNIAAGQTTFRLWGTMAVMDLTGWQATVTDGVNTDSTTITGMPINTPYMILPVSPAFTHAFTYGHNLVATLQPPIGQKFHITFGTGSNVSTLYTITAYNPATRAATVTPAMPQLDATSRIVWGATEPPQQAYWGSGIHANNTADFLFSQNVLDHNGWGRPDNDPKWNTMFSHGIYAGTGARDWMIWGNWVLDNSNVGIGLRGGGPIAYNIIASNSQGSSQLNTSSMTYRNVYWKNGDNQIALGRGLDDVVNHVVVDFNMIISPSRLSPARTPVNGGVGINMEYEAADGAPAYMVVRNNTMTGTMGVHIAGRPPVPGTFNYIRNLLDNGTQIQPNGTPIKVFTADPLALGWNINGPITVPTSAVWSSADANAYLVKSATNNWSWLGTNYATLTDFQTTGNEPKSISLPAFSYANGSFGLDTWSLSNGTGATYEAFRGALKAREGSTWGNAYDTIKCYKAFQSAYKPDKTKVPAIDSTTYGFYGASDNR